MMECKASNSPKTSLTKAFKDKEGSEEQKVEILNSSSVNINSENHPLKTEKLEVPHVVHDDPLHLTSKGMPNMVKDEQPNYKLILNDVNFDAEKVNGQLQLSTTVKLESKATNDSKFKVNRQKVIANNDNKLNVSGTVSLHKESFTCLECGDIFNKNVDYENHMVSCTKSVDSSTCEVYNKRFSKLYLMKGHRSEEHGDNSDKYNDGLQGCLTDESRKKPHVCVHCDKKFSNAGHLNRHLRIHTGAKPYHCDQCNASFTQSGSLKHHIHTLHTGEKSFCCPHCDARFSHSGHYNQHLRLHTGEKPFKCQECGLSFTRSGSLKQHMQTHTGMKPYKCPLCDRSFSRSFVLSQHVRTHTGEKPFLCSKCGMEFSRMDRLRLHMKDHEVN